MNTIKLYKSLADGLGDIVETPAVLFLQDIQEVIYVPTSLGDKVKVIKNTLKDTVIDVKEYKSTKIYYTSSVGNVITPYKTDVFGANIVSNTYENGQGCITFDDEVTSIGDYAFNSCSNLTSITIPDSVTSIGDYAFSHTGLTSITIPDSVTSIGECAFWQCSNLTSITIPDSVTSIGDYAFSHTGLTSITIPDSVTSIGDGVFVVCTKLTSVTIPDSVTSISDYAFYECSNLTSITIPDSVISIGLGTFNYCTNLTSVEYKGTTYTYKTDLITELKENGVYVGQYAFNDTGLKKYAGGSSSSL